MPNTMPNPTRAPQVLPATAQCPKAVQPPQNLPQEFCVRLAKLPLALVSVSVSATAGKNAPTENHPTTGRPAPTPCGPRSTKTMATKTLAPTATASNVGGVGVRETEGVMKTRARQSPNQEPGRFKASPVKNEWTFFLVGVGHAVRFVGVGWGVGCERGTDPRLYLFCLE